MRNYGLKMRDNNTTSTITTDVENFFATPNEVNEKPAWLRIQEGDDSATADYLKELTPTITKAVNVYAQGDKLYTTQARILAIGAAKNYDPKKGASITTHVMNQLRPLQRLAAQRSNLTRVSENVAQQRSVVQRAIRELRADNGEEPTTEQIATRVGMTTKRVDDLMNYRPVIPDSIAVSPEGDSLGAHEVDRALTLYDTVIYNELDDTDKRIYEWSTGYGKGEKLSGVEIARRLNITPAAVSKRYARIVSKFGEDRDLIRRMINGESRN